MRLLRLIVTFCCLWPWVAGAVAFEFGEPYFESVGDAESIPDNNVTALAQDRAGFIWIGTTDGLIRYDGYRFSYFGNNPADPRTAIVFDPAIRGKTDQVVLRFRKP